MTNTLLTLPSVCERSFEDLIKLAYDELGNYVGERKSSPTVNTKIREQLSVEEQVQVESISEIRTYVDKTIPKLTEEQFYKAVKDIIKEDKGEKRIAGSILSGSIFKSFNDDNDFGFGLYPSRKKTTVFVQWLGAHAYERPKIIGIAKRLIQLPLDYTEHEDLRKKVVLNLRRYETSQVREKRYKDFLKFQEQLEEIALPKFQEMHAKELLERANVLNKFNDLQSLVLERRTRELTEIKLELGIDYRASILRKRRNEKLGYPSDEAREIVHRTMYFESGFKPFIGVYLDVSSSISKYRLLSIVRKLALAADYVYSKFPDDVEHVIVPFDDEVGEQLK